MKMIPNKTSSKRRVEREEKGKQAAAMYIVSAGVGEVTGAYIDDGMDLHQRSLKIASPVTFFRYRQ